MEKNFGKFSEHNTEKKDKKEIAQYFAEGREAFSRGESLDKNPYNNHKPRANQAWGEGWLEESQAGKN